MATTLGSDDGASAAVLRATVRRLESEVRFLRGCGAAAFLLALMGILMGLQGSGPSDLRAGTIRAKRILIEDETSDTVVGEFGQRGGCGVVTVRGKGESKRAELCGGSAGALAQDAGLAVFDRSGEKRASIGIGYQSDEPATLEVTDPFKKESGSYPARILLCVTGHRPAMYFYDEAGKLLYRAPE